MSFNAILENKSLAKISGFTESECQTVWMKIRLEKNYISYMFPFYPYIIVSSCIYHVQINLNKICLNQTVYKGYQQTTNAATSKES